MGEMMACTLAIKVLMRVGECIGWHHSTITVLTPSVSLLLAAFVMMTASTSRH